MRLAIRSLRVKLSALYIAFTLISMVCLGCFSYLYMGHALETSRERTMQAREERVVRFIDTWPAKDKFLSLTEKLDRFSAAIAPTDIVQVYEMDGRVLYSSPGIAEFKVPWPNKDCVKRCFGLVHQFGHSVRTLDHVVTVQGQKVRLSLSGKIDEHAEILENVKNSYLLFCPVLLLVSAAGGFLLSDRALKPVRRMTAEARNIGIQDLQRRLPVPDTSDELQVLAETWNELLGRLQTAVSRLTQFTEDISHDLGTTITIMLTTASLALQRERTSEEYRTSLTTIVLECEATSRLLQDLLAVTRADLVKQNIEYAALNISNLVVEVARNLEARAKIKRHRLAVTVAPDLWIYGDPSLIRRMTTILLDNAIKYTPEEGSVTISLGATLENIHLRVADSGIGIDAESLPRIFDRFYRVDRSRTQEEGSSGLGLAIAKWVAQSHRSTIHVHSAPGNGSVFTVTLPHAQELSQLGGSSLVATS